MRVESDLGKGFSTEDKSKIETHLERLLPYLDTERCAIVGGIAIRYHVTSAGITYPSREINDLDLIAQSLSVISPAVKNDLLIYHHHPHIDKHFYLVLVDSVSKTKTDIFDYGIIPEETIKIQFGKNNVNLISPEDQLVKTVLDIQRISKEAKVDPKQFLDARLLLQVVDYEKANKFWKRKNYPNVPNSIERAIQRAEKIAQSHPEWLEEKAFRKHAPYICRDCVSTPEFPITPMEEIFQVLGYIE